MQLKSLSRFVSLWLKSLSLMMSASSLVICTQQQQTSYLDLRIQAVLGRHLFLFFTRREADDCEQKRYWIGLSSLSLPFFDQGNSDAASRRSRSYLIESDNS